jgi:hypothetical protein
MKRLIPSILVLIGLVIGVVLISTLRGRAHDEENEANEIRIGFEISPVRPNLRGKDPDLVGLGSYIVNAQSVCSDCHTCPPFAPGHDPFEGGDGKKINAVNYLAGGTFFGVGPYGPIISRNITPDGSGKPAGLNFQQFKHVLRTGDDPDNPAHKLLVMPWPYFRNMTDHDIRAIYEYLRSIPHAETGCP